jgi:hypothetical protein
MYVKRPQHDWNLHLPETQPPRKRQARGRRSPKLSAAAQRYDPKGWVMELLNEFTYIYILIWLYIYMVIYIYISVVVTSLIHVWVGSCYISYRNL